MNDSRSKSVSGGRGNQAESLIGIDVRKLHDFGIGTYIRHLLRGLGRPGRPGLSGFRLYAETCSVMDRSLYPESLFQIMTIPAGRRSPFQGMLPHASDLTAFHAPHYLAPDCRDTPLILTVHDCIHLDPPPPPDRFRSIGAWPDRLYDYSKKTYHRFQAIMRFRHMVRKASRIITVSATTSDHLVMLTGVNRDKLTMIYHCLSSEYFNRFEQGEVQEFCRKHELPAGDYLLYCGNDLYHKNLAGLLTAWKRLSETAGTPLLVLAGPPRQSTILSYAKTLGIADSIRFIGALPPKQMPLLYRGAVGLVLPSLAEGFGFPVVEAMISGVPVACSDLPVLHEISGNHALFFDPRNTDEIADSLHSMLKGDTSIDLQQAAAYASERYNQDSFVSGHLRVYNRYLEDRY